MGFEVDWRHGAEHMESEHQVSVEASEALSDADALVYDPDPKSNSGVSARVIGYANGWRANAADRRTYREGTQP